MFSDIRVSGVIRSVVPDNYRSTPHWGARSPLARWRRSRSATVRRCSRARMHGLLAGSISMCGGGILPRWSPTCAVSSVSRSSCSQGCRNDKERKQGSSDHAADHGRGDAAHDLATGAAAPKDRQQAGDDHRHGHRFGSHAQHCAFANVSTTPQGKVV